MNSFYYEVAPKFRKREAYCIEKFKEMELVKCDGRYDDLQRNIIHFINEGESISEFTKIFSINGLCLAELRFLFAVSITEKKLLSFPILLSGFKLFAAAQLQLFNFERLRVVFAKQGRGDSPPFLITIADLGDRLMLLAIFGNKSLCKQFLLFSLDLFDRGAPLTHSLPLTQLFIFRLSEKFFELEPRNWDEDNRLQLIDPCKEEPLFSALWQHWDTEDLALIQSLLIQLANRHTFQASRNNKDGGRDFEGHAEQYPIDLHFIMRLREWRGLANPEIKHRLTEPPFDKLPEPIETIELPDELHQVMKKVREVIPDFDSVINSAKTRDWKMLL